MCGFIAIAGEQLNITNYDTDGMLRKLEKRGPDGFGEALFSNCWLGHRRLAIMDLENGEQPMADGHLSISFNGEIYNNLELRIKLKKRGIVFNTESDTETILKAYRVWGNNCVKYLDGIFAFVIWDDFQNEMFVARDRLGQKPFYYFFDNKKILMASEIKSLIASNAVKPQLDYCSIDNYLRLMYIPPWKSVYKNIFQVPPAHCGIFKNGTLLLKRYWSLKHKSINISYDEAKNEVRRLLINAVRKRLGNSDVEIGVFLSGGVDSSLVALIANKDLGYPLKAFSVSYAGHDELFFAKQVGKKINAKHFVSKIDKCLINEVKRVIYYFDEPHADTSDFPQHIISGLASKKVKVVLSGDGADELFLGYKWHAKMSDELLYNRLNFICPFTFDERVALWGSDNFINNNILTKEVFYNLKDQIDCVTMFDITSHLPGQILTKIDRAGMMHGLEVRSPFLDIDLLEFVFNLPYEYKISNGEQKHLLKDILSEYMPDTFARRRKQGFGAPINKWLHDPQIKNYVFKRLRTGQLKPMFSLKVINNYLDDFYEKRERPERASQKIWVLLCLELWLSQLNNTYEK